MKSQTFFYFAALLASAASVSQAGQTQELGRFISHAQRSYYQPGDVLTLSNTRNQVQVIKSPKLRADANVAQLVQTPSFPFRVGDQVVTYGGLNGTVVGVFGASYTGYAIAHGSYYPYAVAVEVAGRLYPKALDVNDLADQLLWPLGKALPESVHSSLGVREVIYNAGYDADRFGSSTLVSTSEALQGNWVSETIECAGTQNESAIRVDLKIGFLKRFVPFLSFRIDSGGAITLRNSNTTIMDAPKSGAGAVMMSGSSAQIGGGSIPRQLGNFGVEADDRDTLVMYVAPLALNVCGLNWWDSSFQRIKFKRIN